MVSFWSPIAEDLYLSNSGHRERKWKEITEMGMHTTIKKIKNCIKYHNFTLVVPIHGSIPNHMDTAMLVTGKYFITTVGKC